MQGWLMLPAPAGLKHPKGNYRQIISIMHKKGRDNMTDLSYAWEKLYLSVITLATWSNTMQERLADAYLYNLMGLEVELFPKELRGEFKEIRDKLESLSTEGEEYRLNINSKISEIDANELSKRIISLHDHITELKGIRDQDLV